MDVEDLVKSYFGLGFSNKDILCLLAHQHGVIISKRTLQRLCRKLNLFRRKNQTDIEEIASFVQSEMVTIGRLQGYRWLHLRAIRRGYVVSQETNGAFPLHGTVRFGSVRYGSVRVGCISTAV